MLTPFDERGTIDYDILAKLTAYYIEAGATGLFANCLSSEMFELTEEERLAVTAFVVKEAAGAVPVFSTGTFGGSINCQADFCKRIYDTGVAAVVAISSILAEEKEPDEALHENVHELFRLSDGVPFGFYECPVPYKRLLSASQLKTIVGTGRVVYYKDTSLSIDAVREKLKATADCAHFELYDAYMVNAVASLKAGAGVSCIQGNFVPELVSWIAENFSDPAHEKQIQQAQQFLADTMDVMHDVYPAVAKYFLQMRGFPIGLTTRRKVGTIGNTIKRNLDKLEQDYTILQRKLGIKGVFA
ncbi:MAG: dihydrodipicolinate synthase family protein [Ferruginibacter sp.]